MDDRLKESNGRGFRQTSEAAQGAALLGKLRRAREGKNPGFKPPYGYATDPATGRFVVDPVEAGVVRRIYALHREGNGVINIARRLNEEGTDFRQGRRWSRSTVRKILGNPIYRGELQYGRSSRNPDHGRVEGELFYLHHEPRVVVRDGLPAIVSKEEWAAAQLIRASRPGVAKGASGRAFSSRYLLSGIACCRCGRSIVGQKGPGDGYLYYCCSEQRRKGRRGCNCGYLRQEMVDRIVLERFREEFPRVLEGRWRWAGPPERLPRDSENGILGYEADMIQLALQIEKLEVAQQKEVLRYFVRSVRLFREGAGRQVMCQIQWKEWDAGPIGQHSDRVINKKES
jgi:hypothetical protein